MYFDFCFFSRKIHHISTRMFCFFFLCVFRSGLIFDRIIYRILAHHCSYLNSKLLCGLNSYILFYCWKLIFVSIKCLVWFFASFVLIIINFCCVIVYCRRNKNYDIRCNRRSYIHPISCCSRWVEYTEMCVCVFEMTFCIQLTWFLRWFKMLLVSYKGTQSDSELR